MISNDILKRTPVRLAGAFAILFALTVVALITVLYLTLVSELRSDVRQRVEEMSDTLRAIDAQQGFEGLAAVVAEEAKSVRDFDSIFLLRSDDGSFRAGNVQNVRLFSGWGELDRAWLPMVADKGGPDDRFFATWTPVSKGHLLVGNSDRALREVQRILLHGLGWALIATIMLAAGSAIYLARRAQQKIDVFATTLSKVSRGEISERVPVTQSHDDLDRVAAQINATLAHLQKLIESVNQASSDIAHDLKKPIGRLRRRLELALRNADDGASFRTQVEESLEELDSIVETFEALLRITQIEAGARRARFSGVELGTVLADVADIYEPVAEEAGDRLVSTVAIAERAHVTGDRELLTQLFANLIENAIRHSPQGTRIDVSLQKRGERHVAIVADSGPGIPEQERENVFRRLYRLEPERATPGSGLGLSLVAAIAELHGAAVELNDNGPGLRVEVSFPRA
ncbi:MAG TPA: ATP-binding protein [Hyphomicrobium sp.]|jgi:signal transduction histidine kinase